MKRAVAAGAALFLLTACSIFESKAVSTVRSNAATTLDCREDIKVSGGSMNEYTAAGCGRTIRYRCIENRDGSVQCQAD